jgi:uncharacterized protein YjaZ
MVQTHKRGRFNENSIVFSALCGYNRVKMFMDNENTLNIDKSKKGRAEKLIDRIEVDV